jgi:hypothetical protein
MKFQVQCAYPRPRVEVEGETNLDGMDFCFPTTLTGSLYVCRLLGICILVSKNITIPAIIHEVTGIKDF